MKTFSSAQLKNFFDHVTQWILKHYASVLVISAFIAAIGAFYSVKLYKDLRTDLEELLPANATSVRDLKAVSSRIGGLNHLSVIIELGEGGDPKMALKLQKDIAAKLRQLPPHMVARVEDNVIREREFFKAQRSLYIDLEDWQGIHKYVTQNLSHERARAKSPFSLGLLDESEKKSKADYDFKALEEKYRKRAEDVNRFDTGYFQSRDGRVRVVLAFLPGKVTDEKANEQLSRAAHQIVHDLFPQKYDPHIKVGFAGDVQNLIEEHQGLIEDLELSTVVVLVSVFLVLLLYFQTLAGVYALGAALFAGTFATFGLSYFFVGYLNANTAFLGSIVIGNGINFGIVFLARYLEERRRGQPVEQALTDTMHYTFQATWMAAMAAGLSYGSLMLTDFRGFNRFGIIGGIGMGMCWLTTVTVLPAMLVFLERRQWIKIRAVVKQGAIFRPWAAMVLKFAKPITIIAAVSVLVCGALISRFSQDTLESDFSKLRNRESMRHGAGYWGEKVDAVFERYLTPTAILADNDQSAEAIAKILRARKASQGTSYPISQIQVLSDFLPQDQTEKMRIIQEIRTKLTPQVRARMTLADRKKVDDLLPAGPLKALTQQDLPEGVKVHFREVNGNLGPMVHVYPRLKTGPANFWDGREIVRFTQEMRAAIKESGVHAAIAGQPPLSADIISAISNDGPKATVFAFSAVALLVLLVFRSWVLARSVLGALLLGVLWMAGVMAALELKINFLNFIALPITFGIGVDYSVNIFSRYNTDRQRLGIKASVEEALIHTGGAVALCSLTTIIGYSSLLLAGSQAFVSFGRLAVLGEITCLVAAVAVLPAAWHWLGASRSEHTK